MYNWKEKKAQNAIYLGEEVPGKGRQFKARFLTPGLVKYEYGLCLLTKENADAFIQKFIGCPVIIDHQDVTEENIKEIGRGNIFSVWFDEKDGEFWCDGIVTGEDAITLIEKGYSVSCQYTITEYEENKENNLHNGVPFDLYILNGRPEHLAIVNNPRYERALIALNAINVSEKKEESEKEEDVNENLTTDDKTASNSFEEEFKDTLYEVLAEGIANRLGELIASNYNHNHGKDGKFCSSGVTGQDAIRQMMKQRKGTIKNAFYRKDIGHIDLIWGDGSKGLSHILKRRGNDEKQNIDEFISDLADVIQKGKKADNLNKEGRWEISLNGKMAIIEPQETNGKRTFLLSAFKSRSA